MEILAVMAIMYFIPMIIALAKGCDSKASIILLSLILGWFPFVTVACIIWAICDSTERKQNARAEILANAIAKAQRA
jgi:T4 superinfection immunity protein